MPLPSIHCCLKVGMRALTRSFSDATVGVPPSNENTRLGRGQVYKKKCSDCAFSLNMGNGAFCAEVDTKVPEQVANTLAWRDRILSPADCCFTSSGKVALRG